MDSLTLERMFTEKEFTSPSTLTGENDRMVIELSFRLTCSPNFYGDNCEIFCEPRNDSGGQFTCNPVSGEIECRPGYGDISNNCITCIDASICGK